MRTPSILLALLLSGAAAAQSVTREGGPGALTATIIGNDSYVIEWSGLRIYVPGDTEEVKSLIESGDLDVAFVTSWLLRAAERLKARIDAPRVVVVRHEAGASVRPYHGSMVPRQDDVLILARPAVATDAIH